MSSMPIWQERYGTFTVVTRQELMTDEYVTETRGRRRGDKGDVLFYRCHSRSRPEAEVEFERQKPWAERLWIRACMEHGGELDD